MSVPGEAAATIATITEAARLVALAAEAVHGLRSERGGELTLEMEPLPMPLAEAVGVALGAPNTIVLGGWYEGALLGLAIAHLRSMGDAPVAIVDALYVEPPAREVGIGEALLETVLAWARARGAHGIDARALPGQRELKNLYERFGLTARAIHVHRRLDGPLPQEAP